MDLRRRLSVYLAGFFLVLLVATLAWAAQSLRADVRNELDASERMVSLMRSAASGDEATVAHLVQGQFRHIRVALQPDAFLRPAMSAEPQWVQALVAALIGTSGFHAPVEVLRVGQQRLYIQPNPASEVIEIVQDSGRWILTVMAFAVLTIASVWFAVSRALRPVRLLERQIGALDEPGAGRTHHTHFALKEFRVLSQAVARMAERLSNARASQHALSQRLITVQENERREIARELHDEFGQALTAMSLSGAFIERHAGAAATDQVREAARDICQQTDLLGRHLRSLLTRLRPHDLDGIGLVDAMRDCVVSWHARVPQIDIELMLPKVLPDLDQDALLCLYRGLQEALTNVAKHSGADRVQIEVVTSNDTVTLTVRDNGAGLNARSPDAGVGLLGMKERVAMAHGQMSIESPEQGGVRLTLFIPVTPERESEHR